MAMNFGDLYDHIDESLNPGVPLIIEENRDGSSRVTTAGDLKIRTNNLAKNIIALGAEPGDKVAIYSSNRTEYLVAVIALFKARLVHVNVNYRYKREELLYLLDNSDARFVIFESTYAPILNELAGQLGKVHCLIEISDDQPTLAEAQSFQRLALTGDGSALEIQRSPKDLIFLYTGGTTGMPKGVMWEQEKMWEMIGFNFLDPTAPFAHSPHEQIVPVNGGGGKLLVIMPFMHATGLCTSLNSIAYGNLTVIMRSTSFDPDLSLGSIGKHRIMITTIAGDVFAKPLIDALSENAEKYDLTSLQVIISTGAIFSPHNKKALLKYSPELMIMDSLGSSESSATAMAMINKDTQLEGNEIRMNLTDNAKVFTEDLREVRPGSGEFGFLAISGIIPLGYYRDEKKTNETFITVDGVRYSRPGDWCEVLADGSIKFLGRGNVSINTGGEKVYPEEVETVLKSHPTIDDCLIVGVPDDKWGQAVAAVVQLVSGTHLDAEGLQQHIRDQLAGYKVPKHIVCAASIFRAANGKADYSRTKEFAERQLADLQN